MLAKNSIIYNICGVWSRATLFACVCFWVSRHEQVNFARQVIYRSQQQTYQSTLTSIWQSKKDTTSAVTCFNPSSLATMSPALLGSLISFTWPSGKFCFNCSSKFSCKVSERQRYHKTCNYCKRIIIIKSSIKHLMKRQRDSELDESTTTNTMIPIYIPVIQQKEFKDYCNRDTCIFAAWNFTVL